MDQRKMTEFLPPAKRLKTVPSVAILAVVYEWIFTPPFDHVLKGIRYIGQTLQDLATRTNKHRSEASRNPKDVGLHALWCAYPHDDHWQITPISQETFADRVQASDWMDREEKRLIAEHGGPLRDMDKSLKQTLNLTAGGQGNPLKRWKAILAKTRKQLNKVWPAFKQFYDREKHLRIPFKHAETVDGVKINLGQIVHNIRSDNCFLHHHDFKAWLDERDFVYDENRAHLDLDVWPAFEQFYDREKHLRITQKHVEKTDGVKINLGQIVNNIRSKNCFLHHHDFKAWLDERDFVYDKNRAHLDLDVWPAFKQFYNREKHLRIPFKHAETVDGVEVKLGTIVNNIRFYKHFLQHANFRQWLWCACFQMYAGNTKDCAEKNLQRWTDACRSD
jgi:hypothetical protein